MLSRLAKTIADTLPKKKVPYWRETWQGFTGDEFFPHLAENNSDWEVNSTSNRLHSVENKSNDTSCIIRSVGPSSDVLLLQGLGIESIDGIGKHRSTPGQNGQDGSMHRLGSRSPPGLPRYFTAVPFDKPETAAIVPPARVGGLLSILESSYVDKLAPWQDYVQKRIAYDSTKVDFICSRRG